VSYIAKMLLCSTHTDIAILCSSHQSNLQCGTFTYTNPTWHLHGLVTSYLSETHWTFTWHILHWYKEPVFLGVLQEKLNKCMYMEVINGLSNWAKQN